MTKISADLNERAPECFVEIAPQEAQLMELAHGERIKVSSRRGEIEAVAQISSKAVNGTIFIPFHFAAAAHTLTNAALDPIRGIPEFKVCAVKVAKVA